MRALTTKKRIRSASASKWQSRKATFLGEKRIKQRSPLSRLDNVGEKQQDRKFKIKRTRKILLVKQLLTLSHSKKPSLKENTLCHIDRSRRS